MSTSPSINPKHVFDSILKGGVSISDLVNESLPEQKMYITPWLAQNTITLVASQRGVGKSWFLHMLATMLTYPAEGLCMEPWEVRERANVLLVDGELSEHDLQKRFKGLVNTVHSETKLKVLSKNRQYRLNLLAPNIADPHWRQAISEIVSKYNYDIVMFDNMSCLAPGLDELRKQDWDPVVDFFLKLRFAGKTVLFAHHLGKQNGNGPRGTSSLEDPVDYSIRLDKGGKEHGTEARFNVVFTKARHLLGDTSGILELQLQNHDDGSIGCVSNLAPPSQGKQSKEKAIIGCLTHISNPTQAAISALMEVTPQYVSKVKKDAITKGYVEQSGDTLTLTPRGKEEYGDIEVPQLQEGLKLG